MRQILQHLRTGEIELAVVPSPGVGRNQVLIRTTTSLISAGTERMLVEFAQASLLAKARSQPDKVRQVIEKMKTDGILPTMEAVFNRLDEPLPLGYCNAGVVLEVGAGVNNLKPGDRVVSNGPHAEIVVVSKNLCAKIPEGVSDEEAAFAVLASIGLQGVRLAAPTLGETFVVVGMGLIGLLTAQLLRANGCRVIGTDVNASRLGIAASFGVTTVNVGEGADPVTAAMAATDGRGVDGVLIAASSKTDEVIHEAARMCRRRGRIVLIGVVGLNLRRDDFYEKELSFQVSCSYGPGRYDPQYEEGGVDYPYGFVRWTEQRNFETILAAMSEGALRVAPLISHRVGFEDAVQAYSAVSSGAGLGVILRYGDDGVGNRTIVVTKPAQPSGRVVAGVIGAGNFAKVMLLPALSRTPAQLAYVADLNGAAAARLAGKYGAGKATSDYKEILADPAVNTVFIVVGHHLHARLLMESLAAGKHVLVEKPLAISVEEVREVVAAIRARPSLRLAVGFNRRFSPHVDKARALLSGRCEPLALSMTANAGIIPPGHWVHQPEAGGGRIIGEACHYFDLMVSLTGSRICSVAAHQMARGVAVHEDKMSISLGFEDGSVGTVNYFSNGAKDYPKEEMEIFSEGRVLKLDNFRELRGYGFRGFSRFRTWRQDKGHRAEYAAFVSNVAEGGAALIPLQDMVNVTLATFAAMTAAREGCTVRLADAYPDLASEG